MSFPEEHATETYRSLITISVEGFKTLLLINGGAAIAILAYLGQSANGFEVATKMAWPLGAFVVGVVFAALAFVGSYATQFALYNETASASNYRGPRHMFFVWATFVLVTLSVTAFAGGSVLSLRVLSSSVAANVQPYAPTDAPESGIIHRSDIREEVAPMR